MGFCLRVAALSAGVAAFTTAPPTPRAPATALRSSWLEEQQSVASVDGKNVHFTAAEVAARAALDAIRADGRLANNKAAQQAAWEAAWIAATVELELLNNKKHFAARAAENVKRSVPPLGGRVGAFTQDTPKAVGGSSAPAWLAGDVAGSGERSAAERALANMEQERLVAAAPATAAASGNMDHFASTAGAFKGKDRDFKAAGASSGPDWLSGSAAASSAAPATAAPVAAGPVAPAPVAAAPVAAATAAPAPAAAGGNMDHFASTAGAFKGKDRDFKATGAASGPDWLSGSAAAVAAGAAVVSPAPTAAGGNMDHFASTAGAFKGKDRDFKWDAAWAMGASSGPDWLSGSEVATAPPAKAAVGGSMSHFASTAGAFEGKDRDFKWDAAWAMGASSGPDWLSGSEVATAPPAKAAVGGSASHLGSSWAMGASSDFSDSVAAMAAPAATAAPAKAAPAATAAPAKAAAGDSMSHFASTAGAFEGKDRDFKATGASSGPDWLSGSAAATASPAATAAPAATAPPAATVSAEAAVCGSTSDLASTAVDRARDFTAAMGAAWAMGAYSDASPGASAQEPSSSWAARLRTGRAARADRRRRFSHSAVPAEAVTDGSMSHFASTAVDRARDYTAMGAAWAMGAASGPDWLSGSEVAAARPAAAAGPAKAAAVGSTGRLGSSWAMGASSGFAHSVAAPAKAAAGFTGTMGAAWAMGAASGPDWLSGSAAAAAAPAAATASAKERRASLQADRQRVVDSKWAATKSAERGAHVAGVGL